MSENGSFFFGDRSSVMMWHRKGKYLVTFMCKWAIQIERNRWKDKEKKLEESHFFKEKKKQFQYFSLIYLHFYFFSSSSWALFCEFVWKQVVLSFFCFTVYSSIDQFKARIDERQTPIPIYAYDEYEYNNSERIMHLVFH